MEKLCGNLMEMGFLKSCLYIEMFSLSEYLDYENSFYSLLPRDTIPHNFLSLKYFRAGYLHAEYRHPFQGKFLKIFPKLIHSLISLCSKDFVKLIKISIKQFITCSLPFFRYKTRCRM